ncbi:MAG: arginine--tRNA ligase, partial [Muribaculaceae bacterium]|nr:arginine--tRNA ligase [Muribaculaceae bacterium]
MSIDSILSQATAEAVKALYGVDFPASQIVPQTTKKEFEGNETIVVFPFLKASHKAPDVTASEIGEYLVAHCDAVEKFNVIKGFLNITIKPTYWTSVLQHIAAQPNYGIVEANEQSPLVMIEYSSPNTNKPLHLGHVRNNLLGYSLACIMQANGNRVVKTNIVNDRGIHICKSMLAWLKWGNGITPEKAGKKGDHLIGDFYVEFDKHYKAEVSQLME